MKNSWFSASDYLGYFVYEYPFCDSDKKHYDGYIAEPKYTFNGFTRDYCWATVNYDDGSIERKYIQRGCSDVKITITASDLVSANTHGFNLDLRSDDILWKNKLYKFVFVKNQTFHCHYNGAVFALMKKVDIVISSYHSLDDEWHRADFSRFPFLEKVITGYNTNDLNIYRIIPVEEALSIEWESLSIQRQIKKYQTDYQKVGLVISKIERYKEYDTIYDFRDAINEHFKQLSWDSYTSRQEARKLKESA